MNGRVLLTRAYISDNLLLPRCLCIHTQNVYISQSHHISSVFKSQWYKFLPNGDIDQFKGVLQSATVLHPSTSNFAHYLYFSMIFNVIEAAYTCLYHRAKLLFKSSTFHKIYHDWLFSKTSLCCKPAQSMTTWYQGISPRSVLKVEQKITFVKFNTRIWRLMETTGDYQV